MKNKKGFTLTEILLAVMIVGLVGVALASLTTAATRESGRGRSRMILRDNLSLMMRQLRQDVRESNHLFYARGGISNATAGTWIPLLWLGRNVTLDQATLSSGNGGTPEYIIYCFQPGTATTRADGQQLAPAGSGANQTRDGGVIRRWAGLSTINLNGNIPVCPTSSNFTEVLSDVKFISEQAEVASGQYYPVPLFSVTSNNSEFTLADAQVGNDLGTDLTVNLIVETTSVPVLNDVVEEVISLHNGF